MTRTIFELAVAALAAVLLTIFAIYAGQWLPGPDARSSLDLAGESAKLLAFSVGVPAAVLALFNHARSVEQQRQAVLWRRREYVASVFAQLEANERNAFCMTILDYSNRRTVVPGGTEHPLSIDTELIMRALAERKRYSEIDALIRDAFDTFFSAYDRLGAMSEAKLFDWEDLKPYARYWIELLDHKPRGRPAEYSAVLRCYLSRFNFQGVKWLMEQAGIQSHCTPADKTLEKRVARRADAALRKALAARSEANGEAVKPPSKKQRTRPVRAKTRTAPRAPTRNALNAVREEEDEEEEEEGEL